MKLTDNIMRAVDDAALQQRKKNPWLSPQEHEDLKQDIYVKVLEADRDEAKTDKQTYNYVGFLAFQVYRDWIRTERNRRRLEDENAELIVKNTTPTLSDQYAGGPEEFAVTEQELVRRWESLSPLLRRVAKRSFFGYMETPEKVAKDLGMTVAAVNMARTRIKQHMNGANDG
jgi:DNA-directed RNA polymerase specialized sigma24 family protein